MSIFSYEMASPIHSIAETLEGNVVIRGEKYVIYLDTTQIIHDGTNTWNFSLDSNEVVITNDAEEAGSLMNVRNLLGMYRAGFRYRLLAGQVASERMVELVA